MLTRLWTAMSGADWLTWGSHALVASLLTMVLSLAFPVWVAGLCSWWGYAFREADSVLGRYVEARPIRWVDAGMDVIAPGCAVLLTCWGIG